MAGGMSDGGSEVDAESLLRLRFLTFDPGQRRKLRTTDRPGPFVTHRRGRGSETDDIRLFAYGDDVRHIDRNVTARTGKPHVRTFRDERERTTLLFADFRPQMLFGTRRAFLSVAAAEVLALTGWRVAGDGGRVALLVIGPKEPIFVKPAVGERAMIAVVGGLTRGHRAAISDPADKVSLADELETAARLLPPGGSIFAATALDDAGAEFDSMAARLRQRVEMSFAVMSDAFERRAPDGVYPYLGPGGRTAIGLPPRVSGDDPRLARLTSLGAAAILIPAEEPPSDIVVKLRSLHGGR